MKQKKETAAVAVLIDPKEYGLEKKEASDIGKAFQAKIDERDGYTEIYKELLKKEESPKQVKEARELRLKLVKTRTGIATIHKTQKAYFLAAGKFVDAWKNKETEPITQMEDVLAEIENRAAIAEAKRLEELQIARVALLDPYVEGASERELSGMDEDVWNSFLETKKKTYEEKVKKEQEEEAARIAEETRLAEVTKLNTSRQKELAPYWSFMTDEEQSKEYGEEEGVEFDKFVKGLEKKKDESEKAAVKKAEADAVEKKRLAKEKEAKEKELKAAQQKTAKAEKEARDVKAKVASKEAETKKNKERQQQLFDLGFVYQGGEFIMDDLKVDPSVIPSDSDADWDTRIDEIKELISMVAEAQENKGEYEKLGEFTTDLKDLKSKYEFEDSETLKIYTDACGLIDKIVAHVEKKIRTDA